MKDIDPDNDVDVLAALLRAEQREAGDLLEDLAVKLASALPAHTTVEHAGGWIRKKQVTSVKVVLGAHHYEVRRGAHGPTALRVKVVRGVALSRQPLALEDWTRELSAEIKEAAAASEAMREALDRFLK